MTVNYRERYDIFSPRSICLNMEFLCVDSSRLRASLQTLEIQSNTVTGCSGAWQNGNEKRDGELPRNLWNT